MTSFTKCPESIEQSNQDYRRDFYAAILAIGIGLSIARLSLVKINCDEKIVETLTTVNRLYQVLVLNISQFILVVFKVTKIYKLRALDYGRISADQLVNNHIKIMFGLRTVMTQIIPLSKMALANMAERSIDPASPERFILTREVALDQPSESIGRLLTTIKAISCSENLPEQFKLPTNKLPGQQQEPENTQKEIKTINYLLAELNAEWKQTHLAFEGKTGQTALNSNHKSWLPDSMSHLQKYPLNRSPVFLYQHMKKVAENWQTCKITATMLSTPAYRNDE